MFEKKQQRTCPKGHPQEDSWEQCPFCAAEPTEADGASDEATEASRGAVLVPKKKTVASKPLAGWIVALSGEHAGADFRLGEGRNVIGKGAQADIIVRDAHLSERHASLEAHDEKGRYWLRDLESKHGTFVNGQPVDVQHGHAIEDGDLLRFGKTEFKFRTFE